LKLEVTDLCISIENIENEILTCKANKEIRFKKFKTLKTSEKLEFLKEQQIKIKKNITRDEFNDIITRLNTIDNLSHLEKKISLLNSLFANTFVTMSILVTILSVVLSSILSCNVNIISLLLIFVSLYCVVFLNSMVYLLFLMSLIYSDEIYDNLSYSDYSILIPTYIDILRNNLLSIQEENNNNQNIIKKNQKNIKGKNLFSEEKIETILTKTKTKTRNITKR
jgi:hypothetical protein